MNKKHKKQILVVGQPGGLSQPLSEWMSVAVEFELYSVSSDEEAIELFHQRSFDMVIVDKDDQDSACKKLKAILPILQQEVLVISTEVPSAEALGTQVKEVFELRKRKRVQRLLILDTAEATAWNALPSFSAN